MLLKLGLPVTLCGPGPITACLDCWPSQVCGWARRSTSDLGIWIGPTAFSRFEEPSFGKSRLVPLHASTCRVLTDYAKRRDRRFGAQPEAHFFVNKNGNRLDKGEVYRTFHALSRQIGLRAAGVSRGPRLHDSRHRFAVETLLRWYRNGEDPKRRLPVLSTYLGHAHVSDTYWYLTGTPELLGAVGKRLEKRWEGLNAGR
jgi:integrase/recombinase XerD